MNKHGPFSVTVLVEPMFQENSYVLALPDTDEAWIIDPGLPPQAEQILETLRARKLTAQAILLTHCHADHLAGVGALIEALPALELYAPRAEQHMLADPAHNLSAAFGFSITTPPPARLLTPGDTIQLGPHPCRALDVAGHSPGGLAFYCAAAGIVFAGDALFAGSIGRYDFPGSSGARLLRNIHEHLLSLPPETVVYPGHGPATTIADERDQNPYLQEGVTP